MKLKSEKVTERRQSSYEIIDHMFNERRQLLALLFQVSNIEPDNLESSDKDLLEEFCEVLVDYIAAGHFGLYERIAQGKERRKAVAELAKNVYSEVENTTQVALEFSEKYNSDQDSIDLDHLQNDLSKLGETLTSRIELEDKLISNMIYEPDSVDN